MQRSFLKTSFNTTKYQYRFFTFIETNKWLAVLKAIRLKLFGKKIVLYNKYHPIYSDYFTNERSQRMGWIYFCNAWKDKLPGKWLLSLADILHIDGSAFDPVYTKSGKRLVVECEAIAKSEWLEQPEVNVLIFQSRFAGRKQSAHSKSSFIYPAVKRRTNISRKAPESVTLLSVGFGSYIKGFDVSYAVYKQLKKKGYKVKLLIAGVPGHDFELYPEVTREAYAQADFECMMDEISKDPDVTVKAFNRLEMLKNVYPNADILLHFSRMETFGYTILEAMSFGLPVVSVKFKAIPEMVHHGSNGFLCDPFGWDGASVIDELKMNNPVWRENCIQEGVEFTEKLIANKTLYETASSVAIEMAEQFAYEKRTKALLPLYGLNS